MLTLICGIPNSGKTTYSARLENVIHLDDAPLMARYESCNRDASQASGDVCVDGVYNQVWQRKKLLEACKHQSPKVCIWLDTPLEECLEREKNYRKRPLAIVHAHHNAFEPPTLEEGWDEIIRIGEKQ